MKKIAILDFDKTLYDGYSRYDLAVQMEKEGLLPSGLEREISDLQSDYENGVISYNDKFEQDKPIFGRYYKGLKRLPLAQYVESDFNLEERIFKWGKEVIEKLHDDGYIVTVISGSWDFILEHAQTILEFDTFWGSEFEVGDNLFNGKFSKIIDNKMKFTIAKQLLKDVEHSIGIGDSAADIEFLKLVNKAFLFEPNADAELIAADYEITIVNREDIVEQIIK